MRADRFPVELDRSTMGVWLAMLGAGAAAWFGSGTPVAGGIIVIAVLLAVLSPSGALYATCAAIPLVFHPIDVGSLQLGLLELGILATALGTAIRFGYDMVSGGPKAKAIGSNSAPVESMLRPKALTALLQPWQPLMLGLLLLLLGTLSLVWMPFDVHRAEALRTWRWVILEPLLLFGLARMSIARDGRPPLAMAIALPAGVVAMAALWQLVDASSRFSVDDVHRSTATYLHPNNLALYLERALFFVCVPAVFLRSRARWALIVLAAIILAGIATTFSRGALVGLAAGGAVVLLAHPIRRGWHILGTGLAVAVIAFGALASQRFTGADSSGLVSTRRYLWTDSIHMLRDFPLTGIGLDQFLWLHQQRYIDPRIWSERYTSHPHNLLLDSWLSLGAAGVVLLFAFISAGIWVVWRTRAGRLSLDPWQLGALACLGAGLGHGLVDNGYFLSDLAVLTWLAIALVSTPVSPRVHSSLANV